MCQYVLRSVFGEVPRPSIGAFGAFMVRLARYFHGVFGAFMVRLARYFHGVFGAFMVRFRLKT